MDDHQRSVIVRARIAWHQHQFEHDCYGRDCAEDRTLYGAKAGDKERRERTGRATPRVGPAGS